MDISGNNFCFVLIFICFGQFEALGCVQDLGSIIHCIPICFDL